MPPALQDAYPPPSCTAGFVAAGGRYFGRIGLAAPFYEMITARLPARQELVEAGGSVVVVLYCIGHFMFVVRHFFEHATIHTKRLIILVLNTKIK